ncbi:hypothetical protein [Bacillus sp. YKCMOAS1]|uniref:hypothetical protein n=1 Tax=Bacillus sp. YKCMOAS1 TaxID=2925778 RepID=UPI00253E70AE|nr:hypothetical protein [Bacillus sp. YKCMOAS1]GLJ04017.1 hypothetical protein OAS1_32660 [Bacillus sp. YKCMOAS1]
MDLKCIDWMKIIPIIISVVALGFSYLSLKNSKKATKISNDIFKQTKREQSPDLKIIQNLWTKNPRFELINEASSKLDNTPSPSYLMFIPSKLYYFDEGGTVRNSSLILSIVPYDEVTEQIVGNQTKDSIITSYLPQNFFGRKGENDMIRGKVIELENFKLRLDTFPFLVIISKVNYKYNKDDFENVILSTPLINERINSKDFESVIDYIKDNHKYLTVKAKRNNSIYRTANSSLQDHIDNIFINNTNDPELLGILGGKAGGYSHILKKINKLITPQDPLN